VLYTVEQFTPISHCDLLRLSPYRPEDLSCHLGKSSVFDVGYELEKWVKNGSVEWWTKALKKVMRFCKNVSGIWRLKWA
jgi:hypothetical protein